jgi:hypothetical protein
MQITPDSGSIFGANQQYMARYHEERNHQGLWNRLIRPEPAEHNALIQRRPRLGAMLNYYYRAPACGFRLSI